MVETVPDVQEQEADAEGVHYVAPLARVRLILHPIVKLARLPVLR